MNRVPVDARAVSAQVLASATSLAQEAEALRSEVVRFVTQVWAA